MPTRPISLSKHDTHQWIARVPRIRGYTCIGLDVRKSFLGVAPNR